MRYDVSRHPLVKSDLLNITIYIGEYAGYELAESKIEKIEKTLHSLTEFPHIGTMRTEIYPQLRLATSAEKAVICFTVDDDTMSVFVVCVSYAGGDWQARVRERGSRSTSYRRVKTHRSSASSRSTILRRAPELFDTSTPTTTNRWFHSSRLT